VRCRSLSRQRLTELCSNDWQASLRHAAMESLSGELTAEEAETMSRSIYEDTRLRAALSGLLSRDRLLELCARDPSGPVCEAAWPLLQVSLTPAEADILSHSDHADIRERVIGSGLLGRARLLELGADWAYSVRRAAREHLAAARVDS
jgi:hypothetical protein